MKKTIMLVLGMVMFTSVLRADWTQYRKDSDAAKSVLNQLETLGNLSATAEDKSTKGLLLYASSLHYYDALNTEAKELGRKDLQAWAKNNLAYASIVYFKWIVKYDEINAAINKLSPQSPVRLSLVKDLKQAYIDNIALLHGLDDYLDEADELSSEAKLTKRTTSNRDFIAGVKKLIAHKF